MTDRGRLIARIIAVLSITIPALAAELLGGGSGLVAAMIGLIAIWCFFGQGQY